MDDLIRDVRRLLKTGRALRRHAGKWQPTVAYSRPEQSAQRETPVASALPIEFFAQMGVSLDAKDFVEGLLIEGAIVGRLWPELIPARRSGSSTWRSTLPQA